MYHIYNNLGYMLAPYRQKLHQIKNVNQNVPSKYKNNSIFRFCEGVVDMHERITRPIVKPTFGIHSIVHNNQEIKVHESIEVRKPFCNLLHFKKQHMRPCKEPKVLIIAPVSGHFASLLRDTVVSMLKEHDVYITDWISVRDVPIEHGHLGLDTYLDYLIDFVHHIGAGVNVLAVCQPAIQVMALAAVMELNGDSCAPNTIIPMGGPIDPRENKTQVNIFAERFPLDFFEEYFLSHVPAEFKGAGRRVYPGFLQLTSFINMNPDKHFKGHVQYLLDHINGNKSGQQKHREFYDEYLSVLDMDDVYFIETIEKIFQKYELPQNIMKYHDQIIDLRNIKRTALLTIEGENDDISAPGQTKAAHKLCVNLHDSKKEHYMQKGVGHYGVFSGSKWRTFITPIITAFIKKHENNLQLF